jgi:hypothetical protein
MPEETDGNTDSWMRVTTTYKNSKIQLVKEKYFILDYDYRHEIWSSYGGEDLVFDLPGSNVVWTCR